MLIVNGDFHPVPPSRDRREGRGIGLDAGQEVLQLIWAELCVEVWQINVYSLWLVQVGKSGTSWSEGAAAVLESVPPWQSAMAAIYSVMRNSNAAAC